MREPKRSIMILAGAAFAVAIVFAWNTKGLLSGKKVSKRGFLPACSSKTRRVAIVAIGVLIVLNWTYRLCLGLK